MRRVAGAVALVSVLLTGPAACVVGSVDGQRRDAVPAAQDVVDDVDALAYRVVLNTQGDWAGGEVAVHAARSGDELAALWSSVPSEVEPPALDWGAQWAIVAFPGDFDGCGPMVFRVERDGPARVVVHVTNAHGVRECPSDATAAMLVLAVDRTDLPGTAFEVALHRSRERIATWPAGG